MRIAAALLLLACVGCGIPASIKAEIDFIDTVVSTAVKETEVIECDKQRSTIAVNALKRVAPHAENLRVWIERGKPRGD